MQVGFLKKKTTASKQNTCYLIVILLYENFSEWFKKRGAGRFYFCPALFLSAPDLMWQPFPRILWFPIIRAKQTEHKIGIRACSLALRPFGLANTRIPTRGFVGSEVIICCWHNEAHTSSLTETVALESETFYVQDALSQFISKEWLQEQGNLLCNLNSACLRLQSTTFTINWHWIALNSSYALN